VRKAAEAGVMLCTKSLTTFEEIPDSKGCLDSLAALRRDIELNLLKVFQFCGTSTTSPISRLYSLLRLLASTYKRPAFLFVKGPAQFLTDIAQSTMVNTTTDWIRRRERTYWQPRSRISGPSHDWTNLYDDNDDDNNDGATRSTLELGISD